MQKRLDADQPDYLTGAALPAGGIGRRALDNLVGINAFNAIPREHR